MAGINMGKVLVGGIVAGIVATVGEFLLNEYVIAADMAESFATMNLPEPAGSTIAVFIVLTIVAMCATMWIYAALRSQMGAGPKTAACAGILAWVLGPLWVTPGLMAMGMMSTSAMVISLVWQLVEYPVAAIAGAYFYSD